MWKRIWWEAWKKAKSVVTLNTISFEYPVSKIGQEMSWEYAFLCHLQYFLLPVRIFHHIFHQIRLFSFLSWKKQGSTKLHKNKVMKNNLHIVFNHLKRTGPTALGKSLTLFQFVFLYSPLHQKIVIKHRTHIQILSFLTLGMFKSKDFVQAGCK